LFLFSLFVFILFKYKILNDVLARF